MATTIRVLFLVVFCVATLLHNSDASCNQPGQRCDPNCVDACPGNSCRCTSGCKPGYGLLRPSFECAQCNSLGCLSSCNQGLELCDGPDCAAGYGYDPSTKLCLDLQLDECVSNPCQNGATCIDGPALFTCTCAAGWTGATCETDINECDSDPCLNGATCINGPALFTCTCAAGYAGATCEIACDPNCASGCQGTKDNRCDTACNLGFVLDTNTNTCLACDLHCTDGCTIPNTCNSACAAGYVFRSGTCLACGANCEQVIGSCDLKGAGYCDANCAIGFSLSSVFTCQACAPNCIGGCATEGAGYCDDNGPTSCAFNFGLRTVDSNKHTCGRCYRYCNSGCANQGAGCCDSACSIGALRPSPSNPDCNICERPR